MNGLKITICALLLAAAGACNRTQGPAVEVEDAEEPHNMLYGSINADDYRTETGEVGSGETLGKILNGFGVSALAVDRLDKASKEVFPLRNIRAGHKYTAFIHEDSLYAPHLDYLAYEISVTDYVVFGFHDDSVSVRKDAKAYTLRRTKKSAVINSSLWGAIMEQQLPYALAAELEDIYQWTVDFFGIQKGDDFTVIYDERFIDDTVSVGIGRIWGAKFSQGGKEYYAIPFRQGGTIQYWEADAAGRAASHIVDRRLLRIVQTPQIFRAEVLRRANESEYRAEFTDDASVVEAVGQAVCLAEGERENLKLTTPGDFVIAEALIAAREEAENEEGTTDAEHV